MSHTKTRTIYPIVKYFAYKHLPEHLQEQSKPFADIANRINDEGDSSIVEINKCIDELKGNLKLKGYLCEELRIAVLKLKSAINSADLSQKLRYLLESKDCAVRAFVNPINLKINKTVYVVINSDYKPNDRGYIDFVDRFKENCEKHIEKFPQATTLSIDNRDLIVQ